MDSWMRACLTKQLQAIRQWQSKATCAGQWPATCLEPHVCPHHETIIHLVPVSHGTTLFCLSKLPLAR